MAEPVVEVEKLNFAHTQGGHEQKVLDDLTLNINAGEVVVLTGPSGSGKSTLLTIVGGLRSADDGRVRVLDTDLVGAREQRLVELRRNIGFIFQHHNLAPALTVARNIQMGLQLNGGHRNKDAHERIEAAAASVDMQAHLTRLPGQLSGGQKQRIGIARALVNQPRLILADEPTASLDKESGQLVMDIFTRSAAQGSAVVLVTHDRRIIEQADRILMLDEGRLVPTADRIMKDAATSLHTLIGIDPGRLGRMMSFGLALARVALADGQTDERERQAISTALRSRQMFSGIEIDLIVNLALAQASSWEHANADDARRQDLAAALTAVAEADEVVTPEELAVINELLNGKPN